MNLRIGLSENILILRNFSIHPVLIGWVPGGRMDKIDLALIIKIARTTPLAPITSKLYHSHEHFFHLIMLLTSGVKMC